MKIGVVRFPGTNNEYETLTALRSFHVNTEIIDYYEEHKLELFDGYWLAGGFSYGDVLRAGAIASASNLLKLIIQSQKPVIGVCNGFQILTEANIIPGALLPNSSTRFVCKWIHIKILESDGYLSELAGEVLKLPIAHFEGNLYDSDEISLEKRSFAKYSTHDGQITAQANPNGSVKNIAGLYFNQYIGLMPHPERASFKHQGSTDGRKIVSKFLEEVRS